MIPTLPRSWSIAAHLAAFSAAIVVPIAALFAIVLWLSAASERQHVESQARDVARNVASAVDQEVTGIASMLQALATSPTLDEADLAGFHRQAASLGSAKTMVLALRDRDSIQLVNSSLPLGASLPPSNLRHADEEAMRTLRPTVSRFFIGAVQKVPQFAVVTPVLRDQAVRYLLSTGVPAVRLAPLIRQQMPTDRYAARVIDPNGMALTVLPDREEFSQRYNKPPSVAAWREKGSDGVTMLWALAAPRTAGWRVEAAIPLDIAYRSVWRSALVMGVGAGVLAALAAAMVLLFGRSLRRSVRRLARVAAQLGQSGDVPTLRTSIRELNEVADALVIAGVERAGKERQLLTARDTAIAAKAEADRANEAKSRFLAAASHDLRQPLQALSLYTTLIGNKLPNDRELMANVDLCLSTLNNLLRDLLDLSKFQAGVVTPQVADFEMGALLDRIASTHRPLAEHRQLRLRVVSCRLRARTDPVLFERMVGNLVANAVRYTERGGIVVGCRRRGARVLVEVVDSGIGIPADKLEEIFEEFKQLDNPERSREKGSGLGLAIVSKSAALLGLRVEVTSRLDRGSRFAIEVPLAP